MGGSGGSGYIPPSSETIQQKLKAVRKAEQEQLETEVNALLQSAQARFNSRDVDKTRERIEEIRECLSETAEIQTLLYGGSVAKHTYVEGLSDVDALVVLEPSYTKGRLPGQLLAEFQKTLRRLLSRKGVKSIDKGTLAITVRYDDGGEVQLLPAKRSRSAIAIPNSSGQTWKDTNPKIFQRALTRQNTRLGGTLVPTIKLLKALVRTLPEQQRITGYHAEALSLEGAASYKQKVTMRGLLIHILDHSSKRVLKPIRDVTKQSRVVDDYLGKANSMQRSLVSHAMASVKRRLDAATSIKQWKSMLREIERS